MDEEIFYVVAYNKQTKKWRAADEMIGVWTEGEGPVRVVSEDGKTTWRELEDGLEKDQDFDNTEVLTEFLGKTNSA